MNVGSLEEIIDDDHAIVSSTGGTEYYVSIMSFVDKDQLEPGCSVLLHHKVPAWNECIKVTLLLGYGYCRCTTK
jgi:26S proteasome regulatory subunit T2